MFVFLKNRSKEIIFAAIFFLISLLAFALGYITAKFQEKTPLEIRETEELINSEN